MLCQNCKLNNATSHFHSYINGVVTDIYLCSQCAANNQSTGIYNDDFYNMLTSFFVGEKANDIKIKKCECCGITLPEISKTGRVGCGHCYSVFYDELKPGLVKLHGKTSHVGKKLSGGEKTTVDKLNEKEKIEILSLQLKTAIENEEYEKAAVIRDEIKKLEGKG